MRERPGFRARTPPLVARDVKILATPMSGAGRLAASPSAQCLLSGLCRIMTLKLPVGRESSGLLRFFKKIFAFCPGNHLQDHLSICLRLEETAEFLHQLPVPGNVTIMDHSDLFFLEASDYGLTISLACFACSGIADLADCHRTKIGPTERGE